MNFSAIRAGSLLLAIIANSIASANDNEPSASEAASWLSTLTLQGRGWATVASDQSGYRLRLLTDDEKSRVDETMDRLRELRSREAADDTEQTERISAAYRSLPADLRGSRFYEIRRLSPDAIELKGQQMHAILPVASVQLVVIGPTGSLSIGNRYPTPAWTGRSRQTSAQPLRAGGTAGVNRRSATSGTVATSLRGAVAQAENESHSETTKPASKLNLFFLRHANPSNVVEILEHVYADFTLRLAVDHRTNAIILHGDTKPMAEIEGLIEALDREMPRERQSKQVKQTPALRIYDIKQSDPTTVLQVLQTLLAGRPDVRLALDPATDRIVALAHETEHSTIKATIAAFEP